MTQRKADTGLDFEALRLAIERCDPDLILGFYAEDARLSIANATGASHGPPFELRGRAEIAKHLRAAFGQRASHRVERGVIGEDRVTFCEACEYPDGDRVVVETTLELRGGEIARQVDVVATVARAEGEGEDDPTPHPRKPRLATPDASPTDDISSSEQPREKEDPG
jgi:SnoaL-like protein